MPDRATLAEQLRLELLRLRDRSGLSQRKLGDKKGLSFGIVQRIEHGQKPTLAQVDAWLNACGVDDLTRGRAFLLAEAARAEGRPWDETFEGRTHLQDEVLADERGARLVRNFQPTIVPGLLQTAEYARSVFALGRTVDVPAAMAKRLDRQRLLHESGRTFEFVITESALRYQPGPRALAGQAQHVASLATLETVAVVVVPAEALPLIPWHGFVLIYPADGAPYVKLELLHGPQRITDPGSVATYVEVWERLWAAGVRGDDAAALIREVGK